MRDDDLVKKYFEDSAQDFDDIYDNRGNILDRFVNKVFRKGMRERVILTLQECEGHGKTILDIGCGSGRVSLLLAEKGAKVIGIDYSPRMIELANEYLRTYERERNSKLDVEFRCCDFMKDFNSDDSFNITLALGVFDYLKYPPAFLEKMKNLTGEKMLISYPAKSAFSDTDQEVMAIYKKLPGLLL